LCTPDITGPPQIRLVIGTCHTEGNAEGTQHFGDRSDNLIAQMDIEERDRRQFLFQQESTFDPLPHF
jgi:hypothetical protein